MSLLSVHPIAVYTASAWTPTRGRAHAPRLPQREEPAQEPAEPPEPVKATPAASAAS